MRVKAGLIFLGATCAVFSLGALVAPPWASGTNAGTAVSSTCDADGRWVVAMSVTSQYDGVIHIQLTDTHGPTPVMELAAFATKTITEHPDTGSKTWTWAWTSTDGHLTGPAVSGTATRPDGCTPPPTSGTTSTTTCAQAIPPRSDCEVTTSTTIAPPPTSATSAPGSSAPSEPSSAPTTTATTSPKTSGGVSSTSLVRSSLPASLPATGAGDWLLLVAALGGIAILVGLVLITAKRIDRSHEGDQ